MTNRAAGARYARALFDVARKEGDFERAGRELAEFVQLVAGHEMLSRVLYNPAIPAAQKRAIIEQLLARTGAVSPFVAKLLTLLADRVAALQQGLARATGRQVHIESRVDPSIIGGAIARIGSTVYDGSITRQLEKMREALQRA